ncbi:MAG: glycerophosphodiester phosphodiesterase [Thalassotalea sp.]
MKTFAHRGASGQYPENTLLAFEQAIKQGCDGIELDVQIHPSGELIVSHDSHVLDACQRPKKLHDVAITELLQLPAGHGEHITTLLHALRTIDGRCELNIEVKSSYLALADIPKLIDSLFRHIEIAVQRYNFSYQQIIVSSFNHHIIAQLKNQCPKIRTAALIACQPLKLSSLIEGLAIDQLNIALESANQSLVNEAKALGLKIGVYTVNHIEDIKICAQWGVDTLFSDFPESTKKHIKNITLAERFTD